jgi:hypothetical protein
MKRRSVRTVLIVALAAGPALLQPLPAIGEPRGTEVALAEALYRQARELMAQGKYEEACPKFAESYRLDAATGTLLNLAACHERQGKVASAWLEYSDAVVSARRDARPDRVRFAEDRVAAIEPQLSRLTLSVPPEADVPGLEIRLDGALIAPASRGVPTAVDPGRHRVEARAPQKVPWARDVDVGKNADQQSVTIPKLAEAAAATAIASGGTGTPSTSLGTTETPAHDQIARNRPIPTSVYIAGVTSVALGVAAGITGAVYIRDKQTYDRAAQVKSDATEHDRKVAQTMGIVNLTLWGLTIGGAGLTAYLYTTRPERGTSAVTARLLPYAEPTGAGLSVAGGF